MIISILTVVGTLFFIWGAFKLLEWDYSKGYLKQDERFNNK